MKKRYFIVLMMLFLLTKLNAQNLLIDKTNGTIIEIPINDIDSITFIENLTQFTCGVSIVSDVDGNEYNTVLIGEQCWMKENMRTTKDAAGNSINRRCYNDLTPYCYYYGGLYGWGAAMNGASSSNNVPSGVQGICPTGWHLPSKAEWEQLIAYLDTQGYPNDDVPEGAGNALKSCRQINSPFDAGCNTSEHPRWEAHATHNGFDTYGFSGLPGGIYEYESYEYLGSNGGWWTTTNSPPLMGNWRFKLSYLRGDLSPDDYSSFYYSVRCLRYNVESSYVPIGAFTGSPSSGMVPLTVNFTDQSSHNPTSWTWDFGDGNSSNQQNPQHTYQNAGTYTITLTVSNSHGTDTETKTSYIEVTQASAPVAAFTATPTSGTAPLTVNFTDQSTNNPVSWNWNFGDGNSSTQQNPSHTYQNVGTYTVALTVTNSHGSDTETKTNYISLIEVGENDVYNPATGKVWMDRNLGAGRVAQSSTDEQAYGDLYQWGRLTDGHENRTSGTTSTLSNSDVPGHGNFITVNSSPWDWRSPQNDSLWQGVNGTNNPCPAGYRLPTEAEWSAERLSWSSNNAAGAFNSPLKLPVAGFRDYSNGSLNDVGSYGYYWSASVVGTIARSLGFDSSYAYMGIGSRAYGDSVRCIKD